MGTASGTASLDELIQAPQTKVGTEGSNDGTAGGAGGAGGVDNGVFSVVEIIVDDDVKMLDLITGYGEAAHIV